MTDKKNFLWGIDLGGTKAEGVVLGNGGLNEILFRDRVATGAENGYQHILNQIKMLVEMMEQKMGYRLNIEIAIANDANCFALAEARIGVVKEKFPNANVVFGVIMGTGVGGGLVVNGKVLNGLNGIGGEWGHNFLDASGGLCYCGKSGCVEKVLAGPSLEKYYASISGQEKQMKEIYDLYKREDVHATQTIQRMTHFFGLALSVIVNIIDPDVIVIGGGVGNIDEIYTVGVESVKKFVFNNGALDTPIVKPMLGDSGGVFGAAFLVA